MTPLRMSGRTLMLALALTASALVGCSDNSVDPPGPPDPPTTPVNDTPANTLARFEATYENQVLDQYELLLTADFGFEFSSQADPTLVAQYGNNWGKDDEVGSTSHLFDGFTNDGGDFVSGAAGIALSLPNPQIIADPTKSDSGAYYKLAIVPLVDLQLDVPGTDGYDILSPHDFHLVRGDAAVLGAGQPADSTRWYIRRQKDKSPALALRAPGTLAPARILPATGSTWGSIKAAYR